MADLVPVAATSRIVKPANARLFTAAEPLTFGTAIVRGPGGAIKASAGDPSRIGCDGIAWAPAAVGEACPVVEVVSGLIGLGSALLPSTVYCISNTLGGIVALSELGATDEIIQIGIADEAGELLHLGLFIPGVPGLGNGTTQGSWNASTNVPDIITTAPHENGDYWTVSVAGTQTLGDLVAHDFAVGDIVYWSDTEPGNWKTIEAAKLSGVISWNGRDGDVVPIANDYASGQIANDSGVAGATQADANDTLAAATGDSDAALAAHVADVANPHSVTSAQTGADAALAAHVTSVTGHADVGWTNPTTGDLVVIDAGGGLSNVTVVEKCRGTVAKTGAAESLAATGPWVEVVPATVVESALLNTAVAVGRVVVDYSMAPAQPDGPVDANVRFDLTVELPSVSTVADFTFALNGVAITVAESIRATIQNGGQATAGLTFNASLSLPVAGMVDGDAVSVVYRTNNAINLLSVVLTLEGGPAKLTAAV